LAWNRNRSASSTANHKRLAERYGRWEAERRVALKDQAELRPDTDKR
jgi:hypothetical protein